MIIIVHPKGILMKGKAWEIRDRLKTYRKKYETVAEWIAKTVAP
ncbi:Z-ring formation inhibitor MciZ [Heyndrickxia coagulans]|nr:Z-ring formation inhibitor MciZ [Heyndrickxia coagulans]